MPNLASDDRFVRLIAQYERRPKAGPPAGAVYIRKEDIVKAALKIALEDLPALVRELHSPEE